MKKSTAMVALLCFVVASYPLLGQRRGEPAYTEAEFSFLHDPTRVILHVTKSTQDMTILTMTLYGDGRIDLEVRSGTENVVAAYSRQISDFEMNQILRGAVDHGLAEWDNGSIYARQLSSRGGKAVALPSDAEQITVLISFENYQRGSYVVKDLVRTARVRGPQFAAKAFPSIREFAGMVDIMHRLDLEFSNAKRGEQ